MKQLAGVIVIIFFAIFASYCNAKNVKYKIIESDTNLMNFEITKSDEDWKNSLSSEEYRVLRQKGTERPFTGEYDLHFDDGIYSCKGCGQVLFSSDTKFNSHCGWPSFYDMADKSAVREIKDTSHGMIRTEVVCSKCGGHLGHVFDDGPNPTGLRYCINSVSIDFKSTKKDENGKK